MKPFFIALACVVIVAIGSYFYMNQRSSDTEVVTKTETPKPATENVATTTPETPVATTTVSEQKPETEIGNSVEERPIVAYHYGTGKRELLFVGGIHGGYSWNTSLVAYELMDYLSKNPSLIPDSLRVTVIPVLNPDGLFKVTGKTGRFTESNVSTSEALLVSGRFNARTVDLNRNFDCDWKTSGTWQDKTVSGGSKAFSEPESQAIRDYVDAHDIVAAVTWYSAAGGVFASNCHDAILPETLTLVNAYAKASGYKAYENFDFYAITGDMMNWLAKKGIPAISVLLTTHEDTEWEKNRAGIEAIIKHYAE